MTKAIQSIVLSKLGIDVACILPRLPEEITFEYMGYTVNVKENLACNLSWYEEGLTCGLEFDSIEELDTYLEEEIQARIDNESIDDIPLINDQTYYGVRLQ